MNYLLTIIIAYLLGSIPFGLLIGLSRGIDVRTVGSKNIGATNVFRTVGKKWGILAFILDFLKGLGGALLVPYLLSAFSLPAGDLSAVLGGLSAVAGHNWSVFLRFKGGKGVATSAGLLAAVAPLAVAVALLGWIVVFVVSRYVSLASITAALVMGVLVWIAPFAPNAMATQVLLSVLALTVVIRHHANISRLLSGTENRFSFRKK